VNSVSINDGSFILTPLIKAVQDNKQYLSDIDGQIGDGDHGINMNKGFTLCEEALQKAPGNLSHGLQTLSQILLTQIGGSMGPLYGMFFKAMARTCKDKDAMNAATFCEMLTAAKGKVQDISGAQLGDKTLLDVLLPAEEAYRTALNANESFGTCLDRMSEVAEKGRDATKDMLAKVGRSSRLGERSRGVIDAGSASCCLILQTLAKAIKTKL